MEVKLRWSVAVLLVMIRVLQLLRVDVWSGSICCVRKAARGSK
jgi:hypothetical protein